MSVSEIVARFHSPVLVAPGNRPRGQRGGSPIVGKARKRRVGAFRRGGRPREGGPASNNAWAGLLHAFLNVPCAGGRRARHHKFAMEPVSLRPAASWSNEIR
jgi:hypothetical protein